MMFRCKQCGQVSEQPFDICDFCSKAGAKFFKDRFCWNCKHALEVEFINECVMCCERQDIPMLELCKRSDPRYQEIRDRHYIPNKGTHGQQIHFLIHYKGQIVGIISGASAVYGVKARDEFFGIPKDKHLKQKYYLPAIINNTVFRLEYHEKNLATKVLAKWRRVVTDLWEQIYGVQVIGFETFVVEEDWRKGTLYKADNWIYVGETAGSTKTHKGLNNPSTRLKTQPKMIYCRWVNHKPIIPTKEYVSSWRAETAEEKERAKRIAKLKKELVGQMF